MRSRSQLLVLVLCLVLLALPLVPQAVRGDCGLVNPGFEGGFSTRGAGEVEVANGWEAWWQDGPFQEDGYNRRPEYKPEDRYRHGGRRIRNGNYAQKFFTTFATHNAGLWQRVAVPRNAQVTFSAYVQVWSSQDPNPDAVTSPGNYRVYVGIDPTGGTNWAAPTVRWSEPRIEYNTWIQLSISARAEADAVTVFLRGQPEFRNRFNDSYWDDACLTVVPPTPLPTSPPRATNTPTITPTPTQTATPLPTATPVTSSLCVRAYHDPNGNAQPDAAEALLAGMRIALLDAQRQEIASYTTLGRDEPYCFKGLGAGQYFLKAQSPPGYQATTPNDWGVILPLGASFSVDFGQRALPTATPRPPATSTATPSPTPTQAPRAVGPNILGAIGQGLYSVSGLLVALVALALPLGLRYLRASE